MTTEREAMTRENAELREQVGTLRCAIDSCDEDIAFRDEELAALRLELSSIREKLSK